MDAHYVTRGIEKLNPLPHWETIQFYGYTWIRAQHGANINRPLRMEILEKSLDDRGTTPKQRAQNALDLAYMYLDPTITLEGIGFGNPRHSRAHDLLIDVRNDPTLTARQQIGANEELIHICSHNRLGLENLNTVLSCSKLIFQNDRSTTHEKGAAGYILSEAYDIYLTNPPADLTLTQWLFARDVKFHEQGKPNVDFAHTLEFADEVLNQAGESATLDDLRIARDLSYAETLNHARTVELSETIIQKTGDNATLEDLRIIRDTYRNLRTYERAAEWSQALLNKAQENATLKDQRENRFIQTQIALQKIESASA